MVIGLSGKAGYSKKKKGGGGRNNCGFYWTKAPFVK